MMIIDNKFEIGDIVYLKTDPDQYARQITGIKAMGGTEVLLYELGVGSVCSHHYDFEITAKKTIQVENL